MVISALPIWANVMIVILSFSVTFFCAIIVVKNGNKKSLDDFKIMVASEISALKVVANDSKVGTCPHHRDSFKDVYKKVDDYESRLAERLIDLTGTMMSLDKNVAVFTEVLKSIRITTDDSKDRIFAIENRIAKL